MKITQVSEHTLKVEHPEKKDTGAIYGDYIKFSHKLSTDEHELADAELIEDAKKALVRQICSTIELLAERDDFFIIKDTADGEHTTIGWKIICPTIKADADDTCLVRLNKPLI